MDKNKIYTELRRSITRGYLKPCAKLDISELTKHYKTSISPLRDALRALSQEGLVVIKPRSGYFVYQITFQQLRDLLELREILEIAVCQLAIKRITDEKIEQLSSDHTSYDVESYDQSVDENRRFHILIAQATGNEELVQMLGRVHDLLARFLFMAFVHTDKTQEQVHARIIDAFRARDKDALLETMIKDIQNTRDVILSRVMEEQGSAWQIGNLETDRYSYVEDAR
jgi:DNA-binding GntR family transcriptional regulator